MNKEIKEKIAEALICYSEVNGINAEALKVLTGVSKSYIEAMLAKKLVSGKTTIGDVHFKKVAAAIGYNIEPVFWQHIDTPQYNTMLLELMDAKSNRVDKVIIGQSGCGKTYTLGIFKKRFPKHTYVVTVSSLHNLNDILDDMCLQMNIEPKGNKVSKLRKLSSRVKELNLRGQTPTLIIDEGENLNLPPLKMIKALFDAFEGNCPIVMIGTEELQRKFENLKDSKRNSVPQLYYRFVAGVRPLEIIDREKTFESFFELVDDENLKTILFNMCDNYRMLHDYVEPALREASALKMPLTEKLFFQKNPHLI